MFSIGYAGPKRAKRGNSGRLGTKVCNEMCNDSTGFLDEGRKTLIDDIAQAAERTVYLHFENKAAVFLAILEYLGRPGATAVRCRRGRGGHGGGPTDWVARCPLWNGVRALQLQQVRAHAGAEGITSGVSQSGLSPRCSGARADR
jgi:hypothetical protein